MRIKTPATAFAAGLAIMATPAAAFHQVDTAGTQSQPATTPTTSHATVAQPAKAPVADATAGHGVANTDARALGRTACQAEKADKESKSAFGRCIAAVARALHTDVRLAKACSPRRLSHIRNERQASRRSRACALALARTVLSF